MPRARLSDRVVVVAIDEKALVQYGQWPWPRTRVAELVSLIADEKPLVIGLDIFFAEPDRYAPAALAKVIPLPAELARSLQALESSDEVLGRALRRVPTVLAVAGLDSDDKAFAGAPGAPPIRFTGGAQEGLHRYAGHLRNVPAVDRGAASHGLVSVDFEGGVARRATLAALVGGHGIVGLAVELVRLAVGGPIELRAVSGGLLEVRFGDYVVPAQPDGRAYIRYGRSDPSRFVPASDILGGTFDRERLKDGIVLIGFTGLGLQDHVATALGETVPGVENHAQVAEALLEEQYLRRLALAPRIEAALLLALGLALFALVRRASAPRSAALLALGIAAFVGGGVAAFRYAGLLFDPLAPSLGAALAFGVMQAGSLAEAQRQRQQLREQAARMAGELDAAKRIQMGLLPDPREVFAREPRVDVDAILEPARTVGGDFYDCFMLDDRRLFFVVADVSGKGLPASLFMASVKSILRGAALTTDGPVGAILARAQDEIRRENPESLFVTALAGVIDLDTGELEYANAGHEPPWSRLPPGAPERLAARGGPPLCVLDEFDYPSLRRTLVRGEWLLVLSDGATEAMNPARQFFGAQRVGEALGELPGESDAPRIVARLREGVHRHAAGAEPADDLTLLAIRWGRPAASGR